ncbi:MAG: gluconate 2-dehydrogenase subunit 3 family protein [Proteobacteria bacterium]|nr:gluconate 2-dehydrogenase subunit 3 family protein [Pseudomonadota bacterium]
MHRRQFIKQGTSAVCSLYVFSKSGLNHFFLDSQTLAFLSSEQEGVLIAVLEILFPKEVDSPGATELGAIDFFRWVLQDVETEGETREKIRNGLLRLTQYSQDKFKKNFNLLNPEEQNKLFAEFVTAEENENWASLVLKFLLEGVFGDPVYGANINQAAWKWIEHTPGFPRPVKRDWNKK